MKIFKAIFNGTILSILVFFSISFLSILVQISPLRHFFLRSDNYYLGIGFPSEYYKQFWVNGNDYPNSEWSINHLIYDCLITWVIVTGIYILILRKKNAAIFFNNIRTQK